MVIESVACCLSSVDPSYNTWPVATGEMMSCNSRQLARQAAFVLSGQPAVQHAKHLLIPPQMAVMATCGSEKLALCWR